MGKVEGLRKKEKQNRKKLMNVDNRVGIAKGKEGGSRWRRG